MVATKNPEALSQKFPGVGGIRTRAGEIIGWPDSLPELTQSDVNKWEAEFRAAPRDPDIKGAMQALIDGNAALAQKKLAGG